jgi:Protein of unknown function (DUF4446)
VPDDLTSTVGVIALAAGAIAIVAVLLAIVLAMRIKALRTAQRSVLGDSGERDLVAHAQSLEAGFDELRRMVESTFAQLDGRLSSGETRLGRTISHTAVVRYDAYGEMTGRQSSSMALLDDSGTGVVLSSILHREQARMYVKDVHDGQSQFELSPEENEAIQTALQVESTAPRSARQ